MFAQSELVEALLQKYHLSLKLSVLVQNLRALYLVLPVTVKEEQMPPSVMRTLCWDICPSTC